MSSPSSRGIRIAIRLARAAALAAAVSGGLCACGATQADPVHDEAVAALGPEQPGIPQGEFHRAGQPCVLCHSPAGPAKTIFSLAGTVFAGPYSATDPHSLVGVEKAVVGVVDGNARKVEVLTNCVGNFFVSPDELDPTFPLIVAVESEDGKRAAVMNSHISRERSCAECHARVPGPSSPGQVFLTTNDTPVDCPVNPSTPVQ